MKPSVKNNEKSPLQPVPVLFKVKPAWKWQKLQALWVPLEAGSKKESTSIDFRSALSFKKHSNSIVQETVLDLIVSPLIATLSAITFLKITHPPE